MSVPNSTTSPLNSTATVDNPNDQVTLKRKPTRPPSDVWAEFDKDKARRKVICTHCKTIYALNSSTTTLRNHLQVCLKNPNKKSDQGQKKLGALYLKYEDKIDVKGKGTAELGIVEFNQDECRIALAKMIIKDELSFKFVENEGFREFMFVAQPQFKIPSRFTVARDCMALYFDEKSRLKSVFTDKSLRVCLTTDTWTSNQNLNYMVITSHYVDAKWNYQKRILSFCLIPNHKGETIGKMLEKCLLEWGIERVTTVTLDNASSNNYAISYLSKKVINWNGDLLKGRFMHMRCCAHILNLIVQEGLNEKDSSIYRVRAAIKHIKSSTARETKFKSCIEQEKIGSKGSVILDVPTRWNSTYLMLETAQKFEKAFDRLAEEDEHYTHALGEDKGKPTSDDWKNVRHLCKFLKIFYNATVRFSGSSYVTSNLFFHQFCEILETLNAWSVSSDPLLKEMALSMKKKFDKYWDVDEMLNYLIFVAVVLDPRYKLGYVEYCFDRLYVFDKAQTKIDKVKGTLNDLYGVYCVHEPNSCPETVLDSEPLNEFPLDGYYLASQYKRRLKEKESVQKKSELERYLTDSVEDDYKGFNILDWWRGRTSQYPVLSRMAKDILAIPVSSVASESAFSTGGRVLDAFRSSLNPSTVEALICSQNWFKSSKIDIPKQLGEIESIEAEMSDPDTQPMDVDERVHNL